MRSDSRIEQLRIPPQSVEAEQAVLGGLMLAPDALVNVVELLTEADFYRRDHQLIYRAVLELAEKKRPFDAVTLGEWFESNGLAELVAGGAYLIELASTTPSAANIRAYAEIVRDKGVLRQLIDFGTDAVNAGFQPEGRNSEEILGAASAKLAAICDGQRSDGGLVMIGGHLKRTYNAMVERHQGTGAKLLPMPWPNVRDRLPGLEATDLMVLAGRPGMGKTVGGLELAAATAEAGKHVAVFSLEMLATQLTQRLISRDTGIPYSRMRMQGELTDDEWEAIGHAMRRFKELPLAIDDSSPMTIQRLRARALRMQTKVKGNIGLVVVDYLQLMEGQGGRDERRNDVVSDISRGLKNLAKELGAPVCALSQLNRKVEERPNKRPVMSDLRESGAIEQDADVIAFLYREDYYNPETAAPGVSEFILGKNRHGPVGTAYLTHDLPCSRFRHYEGRPRYTAPKEPTKPRKTKGYAGPELPDGDAP